MIAYMCKYAPIEILEAFSTPVLMLEPRTNSFPAAECCMHPNMCSYIKAVLEDFEAHDYEGMLFTTCCDSARRLYDTLVALHPEKFFYMMDLPRKINDFSISFYEEQLESLIKAYGDFSGKAFDPDALFAMCEKEIFMQQRKKELVEKGLLPTKKSDVRICLAGARPGSAMKRRIEEMGAEIALDLTCTGISREFVLERENLLGSYAAALLNQIPCMRMGEVARREALLKAQSENLDGIIYHTVKFCDFYAYEYARLKETTALKMVAIETDATLQGEGQILTRLEAFLESIRGGRRNSCETPPPSCGRSPSPVVTFGDRGGRSSTRNPSVAFGDTSPGVGCADRGGRSSGAQRNPSGGSAYVLGIDSGSTSTNAVILNEKREIIAHHVLRTGAKSALSAEGILQEILQKANLSREDLSYIVATGYGRVSIPFADEAVTEISCHGRGAHFLNPAVRTILDIGGQDSKAIRINAAGEVTDFVMNDKCAAGTGRFLEMMARTLEVDIKELGPLSLGWKEQVEISSMCSVFAESEVISLIAQNKDPADIAHGIHRAIAQKACSLLKRVGVSQTVMMTGGVAKNPGVVKVLEEQLSTKLFLYEEPEIVGALGAALFGLEAITG